MKGGNNDELRNLLRGSLLELHDGAFIATESKTIIKSGGDEETLYRMLLKSVGGAAKQETHQYMTKKVKRYIPGCLAGQGYAGTNSKLVHNGFPAGICPVFGVGGISGLRLTVDGEEVAQAKAVPEAIKLVGLEDSWVDWTPAPRSGLLTAAGVPTLDEANAAIIDSNSVISISSPSCK